MSQAQYSPNSNPVRVQNVATVALPAPKAPPIFYTPSGAKGTPVTLWLNEVKTPGAPQFRGQIGETAVVLWIKRPKAANKPNFLGIHAPTKNALGEYPQLGTANVVINPRGMTRLAIKLRGFDETVWASVSKRHGDDILIECGLSMEKLAVKKAAFEAQKASMAATSGTVDLGAPQSAAPAVASVAASSPV